MKKSVLLASLVIGFAMAGSAKAEEAAVRQASGSMVTGEVSWVDHDTVKVVCKSGVQTLNVILLYNEPSPEFMNARPAKVARETPAPRRNPESFNLSTNDTADRYGEPTEVTVTNGLIFLLYKKGDFQIQATAFPDGSVEEMQFVRRRDGKWSADELSKDEIGTILGKFSEGKTWTKVDLFKIAWAMPDGPDQSIAMGESMTFYEWKYRSWIAKYNRTNEHLIIKSGLAVRYIVEKKTDASEL